MHCFAVTAETKGLVGKLVLIPNFWLGRGNPLGKLFDLSIEGCQLFTKFVRFIVD